MLNEEYDFAELAEPHQYFVEHLRSAAEKTAKIAANIKEMEEALSYSDISASEYMQIYDNLEKIYSYFDKLKQVFEKKLSKNTN